MDLRRSPEDTAYHVAANRILAQYCETLDAIADDFLNGAPLEECQHELGRAKGVSDTRRVALDEQHKRKFQTITDSDKDEKPPVDLKIDLGDSQLSDAEAQLAAEVRKAVTVVSIVFLDRTSMEQQRRRGEYITELCRIASNGLQSPASAPTGLKELQAFREAFVDREATAVKNRYVRNLGLKVAGVCAALLFLFLLAVAVEARPGLGLATSLLGAPVASRFGEMITPLPSFLLLGVGACIGTWLSFALRRPNLSFEQLSLLEEDRLAPLPRILFVAGLTFVVGMLLYSNLISITIGEVAVDVGDADARLPVALALGLLCGIAERALAGVVRSRAEEIVGRGAGEVTPREIGGAPRSAEPIAAREAEARQ
ncbi:hypothetical protein [Roseomonas sp. AR75]|uniref:hypothetical protein n=1 Tax=Roseomonas sp. AR75 TaxID=2562311 RepID=UPI0010C0CFD3|nr:hypothetical protein [Roseomonas sp. AR75]